MHLPVWHLSEVIVLLLEGINTAYLAFIGEDHEFESLRGLLLQTLDPMRTVPKIHLFYFWLKRKFFYFSVFSQTHKTVDITDLLPINSLNVVSE